MPSNSGERIPSTPFQPMCGILPCVKRTALPGMTPTSLVPQEAAVLGISYPELCQRIIDASLEKYA